MAKKPASETPEEETVSSPDVKAMPPKEYFTLNGIPLSTVFKELDRKLPDRAYKEIGGGKGGSLGLTDIDPAYLPEVLNELFGLPGLGWGYNFITSTAEPYKNSKGNTEYNCTCRLGLWFRFMDETGDNHMSNPVEVTGGSSNSQIEWAQKGALTNALGSGFMLFGYQLSVYKGERSHKDMPGARSKGGTPEREPAQTSQKSHPNSSSNLPTLVEVQTKLRSAKSLLDLKKIWFEYRGSDENITKFWKRLSPEDRAALGEIKEEVKTKLSG